VRPKAARENERILAQVDSYGGGYVCPAVALRVFGISILCSLLFLLDRIIPPLLGLEHSRIQSATLYLWLIVLRLVGYSWVLLRSE